MNTFPPPRGFLRRGVRLRKARRCLGRWHGAGLGFALAECKDGKALYEWMSEWPDQIDLAVHPVVEDGEGADRRSNYTLAYLPCHPFSGLASRQSKDTLVAGVNHVSSANEVRHRRAGPRFARIYPDVGLRVPGVSRALGKLAVGSVDSPANVRRAHGD
jgi:hypothetical protein